MKNSNGIYTLLVGLAISIVLITSLAMYKNEIVDAYLKFGEQHPTALRLAIFLILACISIMGFIRIKKK